MPQNSEHLPIRNSVFYHGTSKRNARGIVSHGLRDWTSKGNPPEHGSALGPGTYITRNWKVGLYFGPVLFRLKLEPGTRLLRLDVPPEPKIIDCLKREFGHEVLTKNPLQIIPHNKHLTLAQAINLARHHHQVSWQSSIFSKKAAPHHQLLLKLRSLLIRYGFHGWGESSDLLGICIFDSTRIRIQEIVVSLPTRRLARECNDPERTNGPHASLEVMLQTMHRATNPGAHNTRKWFHQANRPVPPTLISQTSPS